MALPRQWHDAIRVAHKGHIKTAANADRMNRILGIPATFISAIVGSAVFASLAENPSATAKIAVGLLSVLAAVLTALQTYLRYSERAELHRKAAGRYGVMRRQLEEILASYSDEHPCDDAKLDEIGKTWAEIEAAAPSLSQRLYTSLEREIRMERPAQAAP
jgi:hypothetical protein